MAPEGLAWRSLFHQEMIKILYMHELSKQILPPRHSFRTKGRPFSYRHKKQRKTKKGQSSQAKEMGQKTLDSESDLIKGKTKGKGVIVYRRRSQRLKETIKTSYKRSGS